MASLTVQEFRIDPARGEILIELRAFNTLPIEGVMSSLQRDAIAHDKKTDPTVIQWRVPATEMRYVLYGIITPPAKLFWAPSYERRVSQGGTLLKGAANPLKSSTRKASAGEYIGAPELIRLRLA